MLTLYTRPALLTAAGLASWPGLAAASGGELEPLRIASSGSVIWVIVSLFIVIALIVLVIKWLAKRSNVWGRNASLRSLGGIALGQNSSLQVVEIAGRLYVVGVGQNVTLLDLIDDPEQAGAVIAALEARHSAGLSPGMLADAWRKLRQPKESSGPANEQWQSAASFEQMLRNKMNRQSDLKQRMETLLQDSKPNERSMDDEK